MAQSDRQAFISPNLPRPIGPYSHAVRVGSMLYCSGMVSADPATGEIIRDDVRSQARRILTNLVTLLRDAGSGPEQVVKTTVFLTDIGDFAAVNEVYAEFFPDAPPARSCIQAAALPAGVSVEIECIAYVPE